MRHSRLGRCQVKSSSRWRIPGLVVALVSAGPVRAQQPAAAPLVLRDVTVIDVRAGRRLVGQTVVITGNRIRALGPAAKVRAPAGARVVDARGKYLIPGLWDMHFHQLASVRAHAPVDSAVAHPLLIANGVTGIRDPGSNIPLATLGRWKREIAAGVHVGPRMIVAGPLVDGNHNDLNSDSSHIGASTPEAMRRLVDSLQAAGADFIKTYFLPPPMYFELAREARRIGIPFGGHGLYGVGPTGSGSWAPEDVGFGGLTLSDSGAHVLDHHTWLLGDPCGEEHPDSLKVEQCAAAAAHFRRNDTWIEIDHAGFNLYAVPARHYALVKRYVSPQLFSLDGPSGLLKTLQEQPTWTTPNPTSGTDWAAALRRMDSLLGRRDSATGLRPLEVLRHMPILAGTDGVLCGGCPVPGFSLHDVLALYVAYGMSPLAALQTATLNPALMLHATDSLGTVARGKVADLVLLDADPLVDIWNTTKIRAVVANGRYFDRAALDGLLAQAEQAAQTVPATPTTPPTPGR